MIGYKPSQSKNSGHDSTKQDLRTHIISQSSVGNFHAQFRTDTEESRDQIIRSKNALLVQLKWTE